MSAQNDYMIRKAARTKRHHSIHGKKLVDCSACSGSGRYDHNGSPKCSACDGKGKIRAHNYDS